MYGFAISASMSVERDKARMMSVPPIVGVPALVEWDAGPSSRICWPICLSVRERISHGPRINETASAISAAMAARNVI